MSWSSRCRPATRAPSRGRWISKLCYRYARSLEIRARIGRLAFGLLGAAFAAACASNPMATNANPPPQITCPAGPTVTSSDGVSALVTYGDPVVTGGQSPFTTNCTPVSGASFPVGSSSVTCRTVDALQRASSCAFSVNVMRAPTPKIALTSFVAFGDSMTDGEDGRNVATDPLESRS